MLNLATVENDSLPPENSKTILHRTTVIHERLVKAYINISPILVIAEITADQTIVHDNVTGVIPAEFNWSSTEKGIAFGTHAVGPILSVFAGTVVHRIGGVTFSTVGMLGVAILTLIDPFVMRIHVYLFIATRLVFGFFEGLTFIGNTDLMTRWIPQSERVRAMTFSYWGYGFGGAIAYPLTGFVIHHLGWSYVFYIYGLINLIWCLIWTIFVSNDPATDKFISEQERAYLSKEIGISTDKIRIPYREIFTSVPMYALLNDFFVTFFLISFVNYLPLYVKDVYDADVQLVGLISSLPPLTSLIAQPFFAYLADHIRNRGYSVGKLHQWFFLFGKLVAILLYFLTALVNDAIGCVVCITLAELSLALPRVSYGAIIIDFAGQYAGFVQSLVVVSMNIACFVNPIFMESIIKNHTQSEWNTYYVYIGIFLAYSLISFRIFGSGDLQPWAAITIVDKDGNETGCSEHSRKNHSTINDDNTNSSNIYTIDKECRS